MKALEYMREKSAEENRELESFRRRAIAYHDAYTKERTKRVLLEQRLKDKQPDPRTHLYIGDAHADARVPNDRFTWLGRFICDHKPDLIVDVGDWCEVASLCRYDQPGSKAREGARYTEDMAAAVDARRRVDQELRSYNKGRHKKYNPEKVALMGNHEYRVERAALEEARFDGVFHPKAMGAEEYGWEVIPFLVPYLADGLALSHYFVSPGTSRAIGGKYRASNLLMHYHQSCVQGHSHIFDYREGTRADGGRVMGLVVGCFFEHELDWAPFSDSRRWWRGLVLLRDVVDGFGVVERWPMDRVRDRYGG